MALKHSTTFLERIKQKLDNKENVNLGELKVFDTYQWLLAPEALKVHKAWVLEAIQKFAAAGAHDTRKKPESSSSSKRKSSGASSTMDFFKTKKQTVSDSSAQSRSSRR